MENILKEHQEIYGANQRELSSLQLEYISWNLNLAAPILQKNFFQRNQMKNKLGQVFSI